MKSRKSVLLYSEYWSSKGGGEKYMLCIAETLLNAGYDVTIAAQSMTFDRNTLARYFNVQIDSATVYLVDGSLKHFRDEAAVLSRDFDICIYITNYRHFPSRARQTFAVLQIPYGPITPLSILGKILKGGGREAAKDYFRIGLLRQLRDTQAVLVYSEYVRNALDAIHDVPSTILPPAIDDFSTPGIAKERIILSVGRFFRGLYNDKRYDVMIEAFKELYASLPNTTWQYRLVGSCGTDEASRRYLEELQHAARGYPVYFHINTPYAELRRHYNEASLFWHAAGFEVDEYLAPERAEHFGMSTLEAMSARCVPVVINRGGQKEIVSHGESGYLWESVDELVAYSRTLINDAGLHASVQTRARMRFAAFDREHFAKRLLSILE